MTFQIAALPTSGGTFFKPAELTNAKALLIEPKELELKRPSGQYGPKDTIHADITVFASDADLAKATPSNVLKGAMIQSTYLQRDLHNLIGQATIAVPVKKTFKSGTSGWVWEAVPAEAQAKVVEYATAREAAVAAAVADAPDFD